jgi:hypothetical protein
MLERDEIELVATTEALSLSRLRGRVGGGVLPQDALVERIGFPPPAALRASTSPASGRGKAKRVVIDEAELIML